MNILFKIIFPKEYKELVELKKPVVTLKVETCVPFPNENASSTEINTLRMEYQGD